VLVEFIRFSPILHNHHHYYGDSWLDRATCEIDLSSYELEKNSHGAIANIKKSLKNNCRVIVTRVPSYEQCAEFNRIYRNRMIELNADAQYFYSDEYVKHLINDTNELVLVHHDNDVIAAAIFLRSCQWHEYHLSAANALGRQYGVINLILHDYAMRNSAPSAILHLGGGTNNDTNNSLLKFKQAMGKINQHFYIGKYVHQPERYQELKSRSKNPNNRVIFYR
jgi:hypothetical protein